MMKLGRLLFCFFVITLSLSLNAQVRNLNIELKLLPDGYVSCHEVWDVISSEDNSEWYLGLSHFSNAKVFDGDVELVDKGEWDSDLPVEQKNGYYGCISDGNNGMQLCWGRGSVGEHSFHLHYLCSGLTHGSLDYDFLLASASHNIRVPSDGQIRLKIFSDSFPLNLFNSRAYAFPEYSEEISVNISYVSGALLLESNRPFFILLRLDKGLLKGELSPMGTYNSILRTIVRQRSQEGATVKNIYK